MKRSSFKMIFFALKISRCGVCCMPAALLFGLIINVCIHRLREHVEDVNKLPILIFPEGKLSFLISVLH